MEHTSVSISNQALAISQKRRSSALKAVVALLALSAVVATFAVFSYAPAADIDFEAPFDPTPCTHEDYRLFEEWIQHHRHTFSRQERIPHFRQWCNHSIFIATHNSNSSHNYSCGHNKYSYKSLDEFIATHTGHVPHNGTNNSANASGHHHQKVSLSNTNIPRLTYPFPPTDVDWRLHGVVTSIKDQGGCGSCWTFAATAALESFYALQGYRLSNFSEQYFTECMPNNTDGSYYNGCMGGSPVTATQFAMSTGGMPRLSDYPYTGVFGNCYSSTTRLINTGVQYISTVFVNSPASMVAAIAKGPIYVGISCPQTFMLYKTGIYHDPAIESTGHAVVLVGYHLDTPTSGTTLTSDQTDLTGYYILRNSWATSWGENGYCRVQITNGIGIVNIQTSANGLELQP